jgi:hypothetical protein
MTIQQIEFRLTTAGCIVSISDGKAYVESTPSGGRGDYGYCVAGLTGRDITSNITRQVGEIASMLRV